MNIFLLSKPVSTLVLLYPSNAHRSSSVDTQSLPTDALSATLFTTCLAIKFVSATFGPTVAPIIALRSGPSA